MASRRQGIFWLLTVPCPNDLCAGMESGILPEGLVWCKGQKERGENTGYEHYQLVVAFPKKVSLPGVTRMFGRSTHGELSRSEAANAYVGKEETRIGEPFELGAKPVRRNSKTDWDSVWTAAKSGDLDSVPASIRVVSYHALRAIRSDHAQPRAIERRVDVFWGATGTGKSRRAWDEAGIDAYSKCPRSKFWDGYQDQEHVVIDEFRGAIDISHILRWLDRYPVLVEIKGSATSLVAEKIWITSNLHPRDWFKDLDSETQEALLRRLQITIFDGF